MELENPAGLYLGSDDEPATSVEVVRWLSAELGVDAPEEQETQRLNKRCTNARLRGSGYRFQYPTFREGYRDIVRSFLAEHRPTS
jgi:hypothetical protein